MTQRVGPTVGDGPAPGRADETWDEVRELLEQALALAAKKEDGATVSVLAQRAMWKAHQLRRAPRRPLTAIHLRRRGWSYENIARKLEATAKHVETIVNGWIAHAHVRAMGVAETTAVEEWPVDRLKIEPSILLVLRQYAVITVGQFVRLKRDALEVMEGLSARDVRVVLKEIHRVAGDPRGWHRPGKRIQ